MNTSILTKYCKCGCGEVVKNNWATGHHRKGSTFHLTKEAKEKIRLSKLGSKNPQFGKVGTCLGRKQTPEQIAKIKEARAKQVVTAKHRKSIGQSLKKLWDSGELKRENWWTWKGDKVGYSGLHKRIRREFGQPDTCEHCHKSGLTGKQIHWANKSGMYKSERSDWLRLCVTCHRRYDKGRFSIASRFARV
jgi:hypothetical protein